MKRFLVNAILRPFLEGPNRATAGVFMLLGMATLLATRSELADLTAVAGDQRTAAREQVEATRLLDSTTATVTDAVRQLDAASRRLMRWAIVATLVAAVVAGVVSWLLGR